MKRPEWRYQRIQKGLCLDCPSRAVTGRRRCRECLDKHALRGQEAILETLGVDQPDEHGDALDAKLSALGRCRCGLLNPCSDCIPGLDEYAEMRRSV